MEILGKIPINPRKIKHVICHQHLAVVSMKEIYTPRDIINISGVAGAVL